MTRLPAVEDAWPSGNRPQRGGCDAPMSPPSPQEDFRRREATMKLDVRLFVLIAGVIVILALLLAALD
jgi:hypothetical protein